MPRSTEKMSIEDYAASVRARHNLSTLHFFEQDIPGAEWIVFAHRNNPINSFQESVGSGAGKTIREALDSLDVRLIAGPINKPRVPWLDYTPELENRMSTDGSSGLPERE